MAHHPLNLRLILTMVSFLSILLPSWFKVNHLHHHHLNKAMRHKDTHHKEHHHQTILNKADMELRTNHHNILIKHVPMIIIPKVTINSLTIKVNIINTMKKKLSMIVMDSPRKRKVVFWVSTSSKIVLGGLAGGLSGLLNNKDIQDAAKIAGGMYMAKKMGGKGGAALAGYGMMKKFGKF